jgi:NAD(P)-dependent dehydrogenase (short-subunit alcohol dehydrogenase family)
MNTAVVTGAAQGVGLAVASLLARRDYRVLLLDVQPLEDQVQRLRAGGAEVHGFCGDVSSESFIVEVAERIRGEFGAADALVNNAGISLIVPAETHPPSSGSAS